MIGRHLFDTTNGWDGDPAAGDELVVVTHRPLPEAWLADHPDAPSTPPGRSRRASRSAGSADPGAPLTLRVYPGQAGSFTLCQDAGSGNGYQNGQYILTSITTATAARGIVSIVGIGPARGRYPGQPDTRSFDVDIVGVSRPRAVLLDGKPLAASTWTYNRATHTVTTAVTGLPCGASAQVTEVDGTAVTQAEPAAVDLSIDPATPLSLSPERVRRAQDLLENTDDTIERIATLCGFGSPHQMRTHFTRINHVTPHAYQRTFRPHAAA